MKIVSLLFLLSIGFALSLSLRTSDPSSHLAPHEDTTTTSSPSSFLTYFRRRLEDTLKKIDSQLEMLQDEMEDLQNQGAAADIWTVNRVQEQINQTLVRKEAFLANKTSTELDQEAYEETEKENLKEKEMEKELEEEEHWYRILLIAFIVLGFLYVRTKHQRVGRFSGYKPVNNNGNEDNDDTIPGIELEER